MIDLRRIQGPPPIQDSPAAPQQQKSNVDFSEVLGRARAGLTDLKFSAHALNRMEERGIGLSSIELERLEDAVKSASQKGSKSSLMLLDERAFVISVANRTVITAMDSDGMKDQMVTDIDSAVIL
ncbi:flagellar protein [bacterium]|nr:flagellar protein [bacterium]MBU1651086.1 flagellar protein [bacterium]